MIRIFPLPGNLIPHSSLIVEQIIEMILCADVIWMYGAVNTRKNKLLVKVQASECLSRNLRSGMHTSSRAAL